jgi:ribosome-binding protein aMBF1 (putative translation factor)
MKNEFNGRDVQGHEKQVNHQKQFVFVVESCAHFRSFGIHTSMNANNAIEKLQ